MMNEPTDDAHEDEHPDEECPEDECPDDKRPGDERLLELLAELLDRMSRAEAAALLGVSVRTVIRTSSEKRLSPRMRDTLTLRLAKDRAGERDGDQAASRAPSPDAAELEERVAHDRRGGSRLVRRPRGANPRARVALLGVTLRGAVHRAGTGGSRGLGAAHDPGERPPGRAEPRGGGVEYLPQHRSDALRGATRSHA